MFGIPSQDEIQGKISELQQMILNHEETYHFAGVTVSVKPMSITNLYFEDGAVITAQLVQETINMAFENHNTANQKITEVFISNLSPTYRMIFEQMKLQ